MGLTRSERRALNVMARRMAAEDPDYDRMLSTFGGREGTALAAPSRWMVFPLLVVAALLAAAAVTLPLVAGAPQPVDGGGSIPAGQHVPYTGR